MIGMIKMATTIIREPKQKRSIEKKKRIMETGMDLISKNGYHNTTTADIAKAAHVSTGIVYSYFKDKKDILLYGLEVFFIKIQDPIYDFFKPLHNNSVQFKNTSDFTHNLGILIDSFVTRHLQFKELHQELVALASTDSDIAEIVRKFENVLILKLTELCLEEGITSPHLIEKIHIMYNMVESYCHELIYNKNDALDYDAVKQETIRCFYFFLFGDPYDS